MSLLLEKQHDYMLRAMNDLEPPVMATPVVFGTPGSTSYKYRATFRTIVGETTPTAEVEVTTGPATLNSVDFIRLSLESVPAAATYVRFYKYDSGDGRYELLGEVAASVAVLDDTGQATQDSYLVPSTNTSGRPEWRALLWHHGRYLQRQELMDLQWILLRGIKDLGDTIHKNGDIHKGCAAQAVDGQPLQWNFTSGEIYYDGQFISVPGTSTPITLTGSGTETVGVVITPTIVTSDDDNVIRNQDEAVDLAYAQNGADRLTYQYTWGIDQDGQVDIQEFLDGQLVIKTQRTERTELQKQLARRTHDVSGSFVVRRFPCKIKEHSTDSSKVRAELAAGKAYPLGVEIETKGSVFLPVDKAREYATDNGSSAQGYVSPGGNEVGTNTETFNLNGTTLNLKIGDGNSHAVNFSSDGMTAAQVASQIESTVNAYPTSGTLVDCADSSGRVRIQAVDGKKLIIQSGTANTVLGVTAGTHNPTYTGVYQANQEYVKAATDFVYNTEVVEAVTHDGTSHKDLLNNTNVTAIIGASAAEADAHDEKWDWQNGVDFGQSGNYIDFTLYGGSDPSNGQTYYVKYRYNRTAVKQYQKLVRVIDAQITKGAEDGQDNIVFDSHTSAYEVETGDPVAGLSGGVTNVLSILRVNDSAGQSTSDYTSYSLKRNAYPWGFNNSQIDWSAAGTQGTTPDGQPITSATYYVSFEFWYVSVAGDVVTADSYDSYANINEYNSLKLRDCIDYRTSGAKPVPGSSPTFDLDYYLSRIDRIVLSPEGTFSVIKGKAALFPVPPRIPANVMPLMILKLSPYTYQLSEVKPIDISNIRTPQVGIDELRRRIERLEYWVLINSYEKSADEQSAAVSGKGMFVDPTTGQGRANVQFSKTDQDSTLVEFNAAIDQEKRCVRLPASEDPKVLTLDMVNSTNIVRVGKVIMASFTESIHQAQTKASQVMNVNPDEVFSWIGTLDLDPEEDFFSDTETLPDVNVNFDGNYDALVELADETNAARGRQIQWGAWRMQWDDSAGWAERLPDPDDIHWSDVDQGETNQFGWSLNAMRERTGTLTTLMPERELVDLGDRVVDVSLAPFMRTKYPDDSPFEIACTVQGMSPSVEIACTIADVPVDLTATGATSAGSNTYEGKTTVLTDSAGYATCKFTMPSGIRTGEQLVKVFQYDDPEDTFCMAQFVSHGFRQKVQGTTVGFATLRERTEVFTEQQWHYGDPLAQTFNVESGTVYISSVEIAFASKAANLPVTCEIREAFEGKPTRRVLQSATMTPNNVNVSADGSAWTKFSFENVVGYTPGEYSIVLIANTTEYEVYVAELGEIDILTGQVIAQQAHGGVLFHSPNNSYWQGETKKDLKFKINKSNFQNNCQVVWDEITGIQANALALAISQFLPPDCNLQWSYSLDGSLWTPFLPGVDTELGSVVSSVSLLCDVTQVGGSFQLAEKYAGIVLLLNELSADYVGNNVTQTDASNLPNKIRLLVDLDTDGVNGTGTRTVTPYWSPDLGEHWIELEPTADYDPVAVGDGTFEKYSFETPDSHSITSSTDATPIVVTSAGHGLKDNQVISISGHTTNTNANGVRRAKNVTADTYELYDPDTGSAIAGSGGGAGSGGTAQPYEFDQYMIRLNLATTNRAVTPRAKNIAAISYGDMT